MNGNGDLSFVMKTISNRMCTISLFDRIFTIGLVYKPTQPFKLMKELVPVVEDTSKLRLL